VIAPVFAAVDVQGWNPAGSQSEQYKTVPLSWFPKAAKDTAATTSGPPASVATPFAVGVATNASRVEFFKRTLLASWTEVCPDSLYRP
jgi:hypothetical protein